MRMAIHVHLEGRFAGSVLVHTPAGRFYRFPGTPSSSREAVAMVRKGLARTGFEHLVGKADAYTKRDRESYGYTLSVEEDEHA